MCARLKLGPRVNFYPPDILREDMDTARQGLLPRGRAQSRNEFIIECVEMRLWFIKGCRHDYYATREILPLNRPAMGPGGPVVSLIENDNDL